MIKKVRRLKEKKRRVSSIGAVPGTISIAEDALKPKLYIHSYTATDMLTCQGSGVSDILAWLRKYPQYSHWIQVKGLGSTEFFEGLASQMNINRLVLEDILSSHQRPKFEEYGDYAFLVSRLLLFDKEDALVNIQISMIIKGNMLMTFQEDYTDYFGTIVSRLMNGKSVIRTAGVGYLAYALMDIILDNYFSILMKAGDYLDDIEDRLYQSPSKKIMFEAQQLKRTLIALRRCVWPERDKINDILRSNNASFSDEVKIYLKDAYDHCVQLMDLVETYREITASIIDMYLSMISNRMNEIMKVLTIISSIFIPLTFIVGVYGMNFSRQDPVTGKIMPANMPELYMPHGYVYALLIMLLIGIIQVLFFWKKGWFNKL